jgi:hypothetical protein
MEYKASMSLVFFVGIALNGMQSPISRDLCVAGCDIVLAKNSQQYPVRACYPSLATVTGINEFLAARTDEGYTVVRCAITLTEQRRFILAECALASFEATFRQAALLSPGSKLQSRMNYLMRSIERWSGQTHKVVYIEDTVIPQLCDMRMSLKSTSIGKYETETALFIVWRD